MDTVNKPMSTSVWTDNSLYQNGVFITGGRFQSRRTWTNSRAGENNPRWRSQVARGINATTPFIAHQRDLFDVPVAGVMYWTKVPYPPHAVNTYYVHQAENGTLPDDPTGYGVDRADTLARQQFVARYRSRRTQFMTGVFVGELQRAVHMIRNPAQALREALPRYHADVKKRLRRSKGNPNKVVQNTWLEYVYGWRPLIGDVQDACRLATANPIAATEPISSNATEQWKTARGYLTTNCFAIGGPFWTRTYWLENSVSVRYLGAAHAENSPPSFPEQLGLSWSNLLPTVWELIPYSFLVDYFSNVGKVIEGVSTGAINLSWSCKTVRRESVAQCDTIINRQLNDAQFGSGGWSGFISGSGVTGRYKSISRSSPGSVSVGLSDLHFKAPGTTTKWLNIAALASLRT